MSTQDWSRLVRKGGGKANVDADSIPLRCGTYTGYAAHYYYKVLPPCEDCKNARNEYMKQWSGNNKQDRAKRWKVFKSKKPDYKKDYHKKNPDKSRIHARRRRAKKKECEVVPYLEFEVIETYGTNCHICNNEINLNASRKQGVGDWEYGLHIDHIIPISKGGSDSLENVRPAHVLCNLKKGNIIGL